MTPSPTPDSSQTTPYPPLNVDVLCAGFACHDLVFDVPQHPGPDEKTRATALLNCGGGLASNAAVTAARLGCRTAFAGYVGADVYGDLHLAEFQADGVITDWVVRGGEPTPLSAIIVKPNGLRTIVNYRGHSEGACAGHFDLAKLHTQSILIDGHQFELAKELTQYAKTNRVPIVIDADALRPQTAELVQLVDYVVASERFAQEYGGEGDAAAGLAKLAQVAPNVVVTLGDRGLIWQRGDGRGSLAAFPINAVDTTGAGDAFHGAFAAGLAQGMAWDELLRYASAVGALCCTKVGGRVGIPTGQEVTAFLMQHANELRG
ncbi:MAG: carbohydrate kinase [Caldilineaceae bacterium]|nr:carbohydrate kinase [Caldilineaceae bacterium]